MSNSNTSMPEEQPKSIEPTKQAPQGELPARKGKLEQKQELKERIREIVSLGFVGDIIIDQDPEAALAFAKQEYDEKSPINNGSRLVFWTNAFCTSKTPVPVLCTSRAKSK
jgi:hypothetical protein